MQHSDKLHVCQKKQIVIILAQGLSDHQKTLM